MSRGSFRLGLVAPVVHVKAYGQNTYKVVSRLKGFLCIEQRVSTCKYVRKSVSIQHQDFHVFYCENKCTSFDLALVSDRNSF